MYVIKDQVIRISVRNLVEFICRSGDINNKGGGVSDVRLMQEGARIHKKIQKSMGAAYHAEVPLRLDIPTECVDGSAYEIRIEGRADGIICDMEEYEDGTKVPASEVTIDEIKTMQADVMALKEPVLVHRAQAMCYGYIYATQNGLSKIGIQMTYCNPETENIKKFNEVFTYEQIESWFHELLEKFMRWTDFIFTERKKRKDSIQNLDFPFAYRRGQKDLVVSVYKAIIRSKNLYIQAPTGVGKTISTIFPAVQAMGQDEADKIFYLTSKTITRTVAEDTFSILRTHGLLFRTVTLTARDKVCHLEERNCNPEACPYAKGHFDRVNDAVYDLVTHEYVIDRDKIISYSEKHSVCPFEMSLDVSYWCDGIICDYNYVFDPNVALKRYFADGSKGEYLFLVDEAHNLVDRAREMYSAMLIKEDFLKIKKLVQDSDRKLSSSLERCNKTLLEMKRQCDSCRVAYSLGSFPMHLDTCFSNMQAFLEKHTNHVYRDEILQFFFEIRHFLNMYDCMDDKYVIYTEHDEQGNFILRLFCADPSGNIAQRLLQGRSTVFFSATLLPVGYFKEMLSGNADDYAVYAESSFESENRRVVIGRDVSSRYTRRNESEYRKICWYLLETVKAKAGKYMVFFPSYSYLEAVRDEFLAMNKEIEEEIKEIDLRGIEEITEIGSGFHIVAQNTAMREQEKESFLHLFEQTECDGTLIGLCVTGGIFSEGIDLKEDSLIGVLIVGTGLPMISKERNILKDYFEQSGKDGYQYAYVFPGMNKVLQAAGRVIRTSADRGVIVLLDDRFLTEQYQKLYPREWNRIYPATQNSVGNIVLDFWKNIVH